MTPLETFLVLLLLLALSALFSGSETGSYAVSRLRIDAGAEEGRPMARLLRVLLRRDAALLVTLLVGNNLSHELLTHVTESQVRQLPFVAPWAREVVVTLLLTPVVFFFAELLPKDLFRRRPHMMLTASAPVLVAARVLFLPLVLPLRALSFALERALGIGELELTRALGREQVLEILQEGTRAGALAPRAAELARGVLDLRQRLVRDVMVPWSRVEAVDLDLPEEEALARVTGSGYSRQPAVRSAVPGGTAGEGEARRVEGYVLQLDVLSALADARGAPVRAADHLRPIARFPEDLPVDRALSRLRLSGQRLALVGSPEEALGIVTLKDLVQTISGDLAGW